MRPPCKEARRQLEQFLSTLFLPNELIELRFIERWVSRGKRQSRVVRAAQWLRRDEFVSQHHEITDFARRERANVYFGVCPRPTKGAAHDDCIETLRCLWCDIDNITTEDAFERWTNADIPRPSIVVSSGSGIHGYWLLERDLHLQDERALITAMLPHFYRSFGGDHVQNLSRIMRPPGTLNYKDARNGRSPRPCTLYTFKSARRYPLEVFSWWIHQAKADLQTSMLNGCSGPPTEATANELLSRNIEAAELVGQLEKPSRDRSRRDFAIVCDLLRLGLTKEEIWSLVSSSSKFSSSGRAYFDLTVTNAEKSVLRDGTSAGRIRALM